MAQRRKPDPLEDLADLESAEWLLRYVAEIVYLSRTAQLFAKIAIAAALVVLVVVTPLTVLAVSNAVDGDELTAATTEVALSSCRGRNVERRIGRKNLTSDIRQTKRIPGELFDQFEVSRAEALGQLRARRTQLHRINCKRQVEPLRD